MTIIALKDGTYLNTANVISYKAFKHQTRFRMADGSEVAGDTHEDPYLNFAPVIAALPGFLAIYAVKSEAGWKFVERNIIGWQLTPSGNWPLFQGYLEEGLGNYEVIVEPSGGVIDGEGDQFESLDTWRSFFEANNAVSDQAVAA